MTTSRKTYEVQKLKERINHMLAQNISDDAKVALCIILEGVLHETNNYQGFQYIHWRNGGYEQWMIDGEPGFPEKSKYIGPEYKREYY